MLRYEQERFLQIDSFTNTIPRQVVRGIAILGDDLRYEINPRATDHVNRLRQFTHPNNVLGGQFIRRKVNVGHLGHGMADTLIDGPGNLAAHRVRDGDVHIGSSYGRRHCFEPVANGNNNVGFQRIEY